MKKSLLIILCCLVTAVGYSQNKEPDYLKYTQLYLTVNNSHIKFGDINDRSIVKLLGKPNSISKKKWETTAANKCRTYNYNNGKIFTEDNELIFIDLNKAGWAFTFYINQKFISFKAGDDIDQLKKLFPRSWANKNKDGSITIPIKTSTGKITESSIIFNIKDSVIQSAELFFDES
nr:hypothetical protein [Mucilaginibacter sp. L294]